MEKHRSMSSNKSIIFMGTPEFAAHSLEKLIKNGTPVKAVITAPDRKAGRGQKVRFSDVKNKALEHDIEILQPNNLKAPEFIEELEALKADLFVVVAFRMLPEVVWAMPEYGTINLHGSLLPNYRGAAPINWAVINGEEETGVSTFFIEKEIDTGKVIHKAKTPISDDDNAGTVHDRLMEIGAELMVRTVEDIFTGNINGTPQSELMTGTEKEAPKIFKDDCKINWKDSSENVFNKIRGLSPYPAAFTVLKHKENGSSKSMKIFSTQKTSISSTPGTLKNEKSILIGTSDYFLEIIELQLEGKKRMEAEDFKRGFNFEEWEVALSS